MSDSKPTLILKPGREKSLLRRHPWVFSGAIQKIIGNPNSGDTIEIVNSTGDFIARGAYSQESQISARVWTWDENEKIDDDFVANQIKSSVMRRQDRVSPRGITSYRLIHAESDGLPGLLVDRYNDVIVMQLLSWGVEAWREVIADSLLELTGAETIFERSDSDIRALEGLSFRRGVVRGKELTQEFVIQENGINFQVDISKGHKTGFYLDQRENRKKVRDFAQNLEVLDCFSYTGGFSINALAGGAKHVTVVDESSNALDLLRQNISVNDLDVSKVTIHEGDVFKQLRKFRDEGKQFDLIILDPPKFAPTRAQVDKASRGYKDINLLAFKLLRAGGYLFTFSCSGGISPDLFQKIVAGAALDAGAESQIIERLSQDFDHPVALNFPEGAYLKGLVCQKLE